MNGIFRRRSRIFQKSASVLEYGLHDANVATREFALCMGGYCLEIKQRQMFESSIFFDIRKQNHKKPTNVFNFLTFWGGQRTLRYSLKARIMF